MDTDTRYWKRLKGFGGSSSDVIANNFTSQVGTSNQISVQCGFGPTDFIIDIFGYYP